MASINVDSKPGAQPAVAPGAAGAAGGSADAKSPANAKEKTPMCLINELSRFNKIKHQYTLVDEQGPAHKKTFFVQLKIGDEEYSANEGSIKRAQHLAAQDALAKTKYQQPPPKTPKENLGNYDGTGTSQPAHNTITPTVELNALVMKRGEKAEYTPVETPRNNFAQPPYAQNPFDYPYSYNQRRYHPRQRLFCVSLRVGNGGTWREFIGDGFCRQEARHSAAKKALKLLTTLPIPSKDDTEDGEEASDELKSEISLVHELALRRKMPITFKVVSESGPPHQRKFVTECCVGELQTSAEGNSKKSSKRAAAVLMLDEMKSLGPLPAAPVKNKPKNNGNKKKNRNLIKVQKAAPDYGQNINPISRLIQIQQAKKEREPEYKLIEEKGLPRRREFVMQVEVGSTTCVGVGPNKKLAKRSAAENMLQLLGYSKTTPQPDKPTLKTTAKPEQNGDKKVTFVEPEPGATPPSLQPGATPSLQLAPGLIQMPEELKKEQAKWKTKGGAQEPGPSPENQAVGNYKQQLKYLASVLGFQVQFTDFPNKSNNKNEFFSLCTICTTPPQVSHGAGHSKEAAHDAAARNALCSLSNYGLESVTGGDKQSATSEQQ